MTPATVDRRRRWIGAILVVAALGGLVLYGNRRVEEMGGFPERVAARGEAPKTNDFNVYWEAAGALDAPDLYERPLTPDGRRYLYPPFLATVLAPMKPLGITGGAIVWFALCAAGAILGTWLAVGAAAGTGPSKRARVAALVAALVVAGRFFGDDFGNGNANSLVLLACAGGAVAFARGRGILGASLFAVATAIKATPGLVLVWLLARRAWKEAAAFVGVLAVLLVGLPALAVGPARAVEMNREFLARSASREEGVREAAPVTGSSLRAAIHRVASDAPDREREGARPVKIASVPPATADAVWMALALCSVAALAFLWSRRGPNEASTTVVDLSLVLVAAALLSPVTRKAHLVTLVLPAAALGAAAGGSASVPSKADRWLRGGLFAVAALSWISDPSIAGKGFARLTWGLNLLFFATLLLASALVFLRLRLRPPGSAPLPPLGAQTSR